MIYDMQLISDMVKGAAAARGRGRAANKALSLQLKAVDNGIPYKPPTSPFCHLSTAFSAPHNCNYFKHAL